MSEFRDKLLSIGLSFKGFKGSERLQYGSNAPSTYVSSAETGGLPAYIMSEGLLEKEEIADIRQAVIEKEQARVKKGKVSVQRARVEALVNLAHQTKKGHRGKAIDKAIKGMG